MDHVGTMLGVYEAYARPMVIHVRLLEAMLRPYSSHVELMLSQEWRVPFKPYPAQKEHVVFGSCRGVYGACVWPMLIHVRLLEAMLGPYSSHVELMLSQERRVSFESSNFEGVTG